MKHTAALIAVLIAMFATQLVSAPPPKLIREIDLSQITSGLPGHMPGTTFAFSPDEKWFAITFSGYPVGPQGRGIITHAGSSKVLLIPVHGPAGQQVQIDPGPGIWGPPRWSPNSDSFFAVGSTPNARNRLTGGTLKVWNFRGEELSHSDGPFWMNFALSGATFGFVDSEHLLVREDSTRKSHEFKILDLHGQLVNTWTAPKQWRVVDISPDRHLLAVTDEHAFKTLVVDYPSKKVILSKDNPYQPLDIESYQGAENRVSRELFTEGGRTLCSVGSVEFQPARKDTFTECWDVDSGKKIAQFGGFLGGAPAAASSHGSRLVLTNGILLRSKKTDSIFQSYGQRVVWDFRSGDEVAAWDNTSGPAPIAISSSGRYVAEANGVLLRIYELP
ncbi:MAG TPA: hypothetical protein VGJ21_11495 [Terracidiphilus sp.]